MIRPSLLFIASIFSTPLWAQVDSMPEPLQSTQALEILVVEEQVEFSELEYQLIESSGLLSLSQQVKNSAQHLIALAQTKADTTDAEASADSSANKVVINHAQHFAIAKNLAAVWKEEVLQQRLLELVHTLPETTQRLIQQQLSQPMLRAAQGKEQKAIALQSSPEYRLYVNKLRQRPPAAARWQLVKNLDRQSGFSAMIIQARLAVIKEIKKQAPDWQPEELWQNQVRQEVLEFLFYAYRKTPNSELQHIAQSFNQPELNQFYNAVQSVIY